MKEPNNGLSPRVLAVIPARGGSKSIPKKNIVPLCGKPLIYYSIREAHAALRIDATLVSTDSEEIAAVAREFGADVPFLRPSELSGDTSRDIEFLAHALTYVRNERGWDPEYVAYLLPTTPTRTAADIDAALNVLLESRADSVRTVVETGHFNPYKMWVNRDGGNTIEPLFPEGMKAMPRQALAKTYMPVAALYATRASLIDEGILWGSDVRMSEFPVERFVDIDYPKDLIHAAEVLKNYNLE